MGEGPPAEPLLAAALAEADPALFAMRVSPNALRPGHPAEGKRPTNGAAALFLCDATSCLPAIVTTEAAHQGLATSRRGLT
jgi:hypothetical protein